MMPGKGKMTVTGNLRDVMKESISAAASYVRSRAVDFGIEPPLFDSRDIHVHVPEGATPKDGPSAGVAMATAIVSVMTGIPVRRDIAMTGEITLRGRVLPIGGLKEKLLAALRGGIKKVLIPEENAKDLAEIPDAVKNELEIVPVARMEEVLQHALVSQPTPIVWEEDAAGARQRRRRLAEDDVPACARTEAPRAPNQRAPPPDAAGLFLRSRRRLANICPQAARLFSRRFRVRAPIFPRLSGDFSARRARVPCLSRRFGTQHSAAHRRPTIRCRGADTSERDRTARSGA